MLVPKSKILLDLVIKESSTGQSLKIMPVEGDTALLPHTEFSVKITVQEKE